MWFVGWFTLRPERSGVLQGRLDEATTEIEQVLALPELNFSLPKKEGEASSVAYNTKAGLDNPPPVDAHMSSAAGAAYSDSLRLTEDDKVGAFVCYSALLGRSRRMKEANKVLSHAKVLFAGSAQEVQVLVAASQLFVEKGDFDAAIRMLDKITEESSTFARAQLIKADIVLNNNHDKEGFTKCYQQLADKEPTAKNFALLGEAYLRILNPEAAIDALEQAYKLDPKNGRLRGRIGEENCLLQCFGDPLLTIVPVPQPVVVHGAVVYA
jgi:tetratricopeptide (TPR) repeat protein